MRIAIIENGIISNVIVVSDGAKPESFGGVALPEGLWIGDQISDSTEPSTEVSVWDELDGAYQEGVNSAYDS